MHICLTNHRVEGCGAGSCALVEVVPLNPIGVDNPHPTLLVGEGAAEGGFEFVATAGYDCPLALIPIVNLQLGVGLYHNAPLGSFVNSLNVGRQRVHKSNLLKAVLFGVVTQAEYRTHPNNAPRIAKEGFYLVVGKAVGIACVEIVVVVVAVVFV